MINPIAALALADALRDERRPQPLPRYRKPRTPFRARLTEALSSRDPKRVLTTEREVRS